MQIVLLVAGIGSLWPLKQYGTALMLLFLTLFNAVLGLRQEGKAAAAVAALQKMMIVKARVRRDGSLQELSAVELVPGDVVSVEAGDLVPADGRLLDAATLEVDESALTGESMPVPKGLETVNDPETPLGDRTDMVYMNTNVTRGTGRFVVTATGLPTVVTTILSFGTQMLAKAGAIVKRLRSTETLGATSAINSDKTGTLTLNQMTATELTIPGRRYTISGNGYSTEGTIKHAGGQPDVPLEQFLLPMMLASDAVVTDGDLIGDPTEGALVVLAEKGGLDPEETRAKFPRVGDLPFDAD